MRTFHNTFVNKVIEEVFVTEKRNGPMSNTRYHKFYLAQEAASRIDYYRERKKRNWLRATDRLIDSFVSLMGEWNKLIGYDKSDFNGDFLTLVKDESDRLDSVRTYERSDDYPEEAINKIKTYINLRDREQKKEKALLINAAALVLRQYDLDTRR